jgi:hypothetical protein
MIHIVLLYDNVRRIKYKREDGDLNIESLPERYEILVFSQAPADNVVYELS